MNINMRHSGNGLCDLLHMYDMKNIVSTPTCYKGIEGSILDIVATNIPKRIQGVCARRWT